MTTPSGSMKESNLFSQVRSRVIERSQSVSSYCFAKVLSTTCQCVLCSLCSAKLRTRKYTVVFLFFSFFSLFLFSYTHTFIRAHERTRTQTHIHTGTNAWTYVRADGGQTKYNQRRASFPLLYTYTFTRHALQGQY